MNKHLTLGLVFGHEILSHPQRNDIAPLKKKYKEPKVSEITIDKLRKIIRESINQRLKER